MRAAAVLLLMGLVAVGDSPKQATDAAFRYVRKIAVAGDGGLPNACAVLDGDVFAHAAARLADLRLRTGAGGYAPYAITLSSTSTDGDSARVLNLGLRDGHVSFELAMPGRAYSSVELGIAAHDFLGSVRVTGMQGAGDRHGVFLGNFTVFDLTAQRLGHSATLEFAESTFPLLHLDMVLTAAPGSGPLEMAAGMVVSAAVPPSRVAQTLYTTVAESSWVEERGRVSVVSFTVPAHVPVERVTVELDPEEHANFSREVTISAKTAAATETERVSAAISRVRLKEAGQEIREESLGFGATLGSNAQAEAKVEVAIENEDDRPLKIRAVRLEMRERKLCFGVESGAAMLFYGDAGLEPPVYDFGKLFNPADAARSATLEAEGMNAGYVAPVAVRRSLTERHPEILWVALLGVVGVLGLVAFRSAKRV